MIKYLGLLCLLCPSKAYGAFHEEENNRSSALVVMHSQLAPYIYKKDGEIEGFVGKHLINVFQTAGIEVQWQNIEWPKHLATLRHNHSGICTAIIFKTQARKSFIEYSGVIGEDNPYVVLAKKDRADILSHHTLKSLAALPNMVVLIKPETSDGEYIDSVLKTANRKMVNVSWKRMAFSIAAGMADYMTVAKPIAELLLTEQNLKSDLQVYAHFSDIQRPIPYYIGCTKKTDPKIINRINGALDKLGIASLNDG